MVPVTHQWEVSESIGDAGEFHARVPEARRAAVFHSVSTPTLVLGSSQPPDSIDRSVAERLGIDVVSRRSGGGAVLLMPGEFLWLGLVVPAGDPLWSDDVARSMHWVGDLWQRALARVGMVTEVHTGAMRSTEWSSRICFHGLGPGEVVVGASKVVGVSQRRTRTFARFQSMCHLRWRPETVVALTAPPRPAVPEVAKCVVTVPADAVALADALRAELPA